MMKDVYRRHRYHRPLRCPAAAQARRWWRRILLALFLILASGPGASPGRAADPVPILLINAYHPGYRWSDQIVEGLRDALAEGVPPTQLFIEYLDSKRIHAPAALDRLAELIREKLRHTPPADVIAADDNALTFLKRHRHSLFAGIPAVFCGANDLDPAILDGMAPITGVNEAADVRDTIRLALELVPGTRRIVVVNDTTPTGRNVHREIQRIAGAFAERAAVDYWEDLPRGDLLRRLTGLQRGDIVLYTFFFRDRTGRFYEYDDSARAICTASPVPVFGLWEFNLGYGIVGGKLVSGYTQGQAAGRMARRILNGQAAEAIPLQMQSPNRFAFDYRVLEKFDIDESRLPPDHLIINRPASIYEEYKALIWSTLTAIVLLSVLVLFLLTAIQNRRIAEHRLRRSEVFITGITSNVPGVVYQFFAETDGRFGFRFISDRARDLLGLEPDLATYFDAFCRCLPSNDQQPFVDSINEAVANSSPWHYEGRFIRPDSGATIWFSGTSIPHHEGRTIVFDGVLMDITAAKTTEQKLRRSERQMAQIIDFLPDPTFVIDRHGRVIVWNRAMEELSGIDADAMLGKGDFEYAIPFYGERRPVMIDLVSNWDAGVAGTYRDIARRGNRLFSETLQPHRRIGNRHFSHTAGPLYDEKGDFAGAIEIIHDITQRRTAEREANRLYAKTQENLAFIEALLSAIPTPVFFMDAKGRFQGCNPAFCDMTGFTEGEILGKTAHDIWSGEMAEAFHRQALELVRNPGRQEYESKIVDNGKRERDVIFAEDVYRDHTGKVAGIVGAFMDISDLKAAEIQLRLMQHVVQNSPVVLFRWRAAPAWPVVYVSDNVRQFGYTPDDLLSGEVPFAAVVHPDDLNRVAEEVNRFSRQGLSSFTQEYRLLTRDGQVRWIDDRTVVERDSEGRVTHYQGVVLDITARREAEARIQESEKRYRTMFENTGTGTVLSEADTTLSMVNSEFARMVGYRREEIEGRMRWTQFIVPEDVDRMVGYHDARRKDPSNAPTQWECGVIDREGRVKPMLLKVSLIPGTQTSIGAFLDISELKRTEAQVLAANRMLRLVLDTIPVRVFWKDRRRRRMAKGSGCRPARSPWSTAGTTSSACWAPTRISPNANRPQKNSNDCAIT